MVHERTAGVAYAHIFGGRPFPRDEVIDRWRSFGGQVLVAEQGNEIVGFGV